MTSHDDLVLRRVDIHDWESPVARQYGIDRLPNFRLYGPDGTLIAEGPEVAETILAWETR